MSKTDLQSTTHGGGRVLSVILAGTLAMGMTPAVALTTQSLQPMQAFAEGSCTLEQLSGATISSIAITSDSISADYSGNAVALSNDDLAKITVTVSGTLSDGSTTLNSATVSNLQTTNFAWVDGTTGTVESNGAAINAGTYKLKVTIGSDTATTTGDVLTISPVNFSNVQFKTTLPEYETGGDAKAYIGSAIESVTGVTGADGNPVPVTYTVKTATLGTVVNGTQQISYTLSAANYNDYSGTINAPIATVEPVEPITAEEAGKNAYVAIKGVNFDPAQMVAAYSGQGNTHAPAATEFTVNASYGDSQSDAVDGQVTLTADNIILVNADGDEFEAGAANAGVYDIKISIPYGTDQTATTTIAKAYTITPAQLSITATDNTILAGTTQTVAASNFVVNGYVDDAADSDQAYTKTLNSDAFDNDAAIAGETVTATLAKSNDGTLADNYVIINADGDQVPSATATATVRNAVTIAGETYAVSLNYGPNATGTTYYYNGAAQAPKVVLTNINPASTTPAPVEGVDYTVYYGVDDAKGSTTPNPAVNDYQVTVQVGKKTVVAGQYSIDSANINTKGQVQISWNGALLNTTTATGVPGIDGTVPEPNQVKVTINDPDEWENALSIVYPTNNNSVVDPSDYTVDFSGLQYDGDGNVIAGTLTITAKGAPSLTTEANLTGKFIIEFAKANYQVYSVALTEDFLEEDHIYNGKPQPVNPQDVVVKDIEGGVVDGSNYTIGVTNNTNAGTATVTITGTGQYAGKATTTFSIDPCDVSTLAVVSIAPLTYNATAQTPDVVVTNAAGGQETVTIKDKAPVNFTVSYANNTNATSATAPATATITAASKNYTGSKTVNFQINKFNLNNINADTTAANLKFTTNSANYDADILTAVSGLVDQKKKTPIAFTEGVDYKVVQNVNAEGDSVAWGDLDVKKGQTPVQIPINYQIVGQGNYEGTIPGTYFITDQSISELIQKITVDDVTFTGLPQKPEVTLNLDNKQTATATDKDEDTGFVAKYEDNRDAGTATVTIVASGQSALNKNTAYYSDEVTANFEILPADISKATFNLLMPEDQEGNSIVYTGTKITPAISTKTTDTALVKQNPSAGTLKVTNALTLYFENLADDYTVSYGANTNATTKVNGVTSNEGTVTITPTNGNMKGTATVKFDIAQATITQKDVVVDTKGVLKKQASGAIYAEPEVTVTVNGRILVRGVDYRVEVPSTQKLGVTYTATITGIGNYKGTATGDFTVVNDIANATIVMPTETYVYDGTEQEPIPTITYKNGNETTILENGKDFKLTYKDNINAGTATVVIEGYGNSWGGKVEKTFEIAQAEGKLAITGKVADYVYSGTAATPKPDFTFTVGAEVMKKADLEAGVDYEYVYANNIDATAVSGKKATVGVKMMGNYGAKDNGAVEFTIAQANVANADVVVGDVVVGKTPKVAVSMGGRALVQGTDFTFSADTKTPGTKTATITGKGNYTGTQKVTFTVLNENQVPADDANLEGGTWKKTNGVWQYTTKDGKLVSSGWAKINGQYYYFDSKGNAKTGWLDDNGTWYYLNKAGEGTECAMVSNAWKKINGNWYHFAKSGAMQTGWQKINGAWYYLNKKGEGTEGAMRTGWQKINGAWYYLNKAGQGTEGAMKTGWFNDNGTWYYLLTAAEGTEGKMVANQWKQINGSWFYFYAGGAMAANTWVGNYYVDANGYWVR